MGLFDALKKLIPVSEGPPEPTWDARSAQHELLTVNLSEGWRFTAVDRFSFAALGPRGSSARVAFIGPLQLGGSEDKPIYMKPAEVEASRADILNFVRKYVFKADAKAVNGPEGVLWLEAEDAQGKDQRLQIALVNGRPRDPGIVVATLLHVTCLAPVEAADRFESIRSAMRGAQWN